MPQPNSYGQYGFPAYAGMMGAGAPGATPGMPQPATGAGAAAGGQVGAAAGADGAAAGAQGQQAQWPAGDPSSYYSNYWGGKSHI